MFSNVHLDVSGFFTKFLSLFFNPSAPIKHISHLNILELFLILLFFKIRQCFVNSFIGVFIFYFPGIFLHELMHFIIALILKARPRMMSLYPRKKEDGSIELGRVVVRNAAWWNQFPIGMAPLFLIILASFLQRYYFYFFKFNIASSMLYLYLIVVLIDSAIPSVQDIKNATSSKAGLSLWIGIISVVLLVVVN